MNINLLKKTLEKIAIKQEIDSDDHRDAIATWMALTATKNAMLKQNLQPPAMLSEILNSMQSIAAHTQEAEASQNLLKILDEIKQLENPLFQSEF